MSISGSRTQVGTMYSAEPGSSWCRNHSRCCANDSGSSPSRGTGLTGGALTPAAPSITWASPAIVGWSNSAETGTSVPNTSRTRDTSWVASSEWPPSSKKLTCAAGRSTPRTCVQIPASSSCAGPEGGTYWPSAPAWSPSGRGSAALSSLPLRVSGSTAISMNEPGIMYSGSRAAANSRSWPGAGIPAPGSAGTR